jgi:hypothetical protein
MQFARILLFGHSCDSLLYTCCSVILISGTILILSTFQLVFVSIFDSQIVGLRQCDIAFVSFSGWDICDIAFVSFSDWGICDMPEIGEVVEQARMGMGYFLFWLGLDSKV